MRAFPRFVRALAVACALGVAAGCEDEVPTATGADRLGERPVTIELLLPAGDFLRGDTVFTDYTGIDDIPYLLVAEEFDGVLDAHLVAGFTGFPDSISFAGATDSTFRYGAGRLRTVVDTTASTGPGPVSLRLWALIQPFDPAEVTWTRAASGTPWQVPGGAPGTLLAEAVWTPGSTAARADSLVWTISAAALTALAAGDIPGVLVTSATPGSRVEFSRITLEVDLRPTARPDTTLTRLIVAGPQEFVFTPDVPERQGGWSVGGITSDRTLLEIDFGQLVPTCAGGVVSPACPLVPLRDVTLNRASLVLDPLLPEAGFRPTALSLFAARRVLEKELGRRAPLAERVAADTIPAAAFATPGTPAFDLDITQAARAFAARDTTRVTLALVAEPEAGRFGYLRFDDSPRLRLVYTLFLRPRLP